MKRKDMTKHSDVQNQLYDYAMNALDDDARRDVEQHLSSCRNCAEDLKDLKQAIAFLPHPSVQPSDAKDEVFWNSLANNIEREIRLHAQPKPSFIAELYAKGKAFFTLRPAYAYAIGGSLATIVLAFVLIRFNSEKRIETAELQPMPIDSSIVLAQYEAQERVSRYFQKSRTLLVGLANMKTDDAANFDLRAEKTNARTLIREARFVKMQPINNRTERLVNDLERILIELANLEETNDIPNVEMIRSGIHQENLLFKIRMAEASFDTSRRVAKEKIY